MPVAVLQPGWIAWVRWASAAEVPPVPAPPEVYGAFLDAIEAQGGPLVRGSVADQVASVFGALGLPDPAGERVPGWLDVRAGSDWSETAQLPQATTFGGWGYPPSWAHFAREALDAQGEPDPDVPFQLGNLRPELGRLSPQEAEAMLVGLVIRNIRQYKRGIPPVSLGLWSGAIRYDADDPDEEWLSAADLWTRRRGDCEDLAAAVAAERTLLGSPARVRILRSGPRRLHAVVQDLASGRLLDPSITGGMMGRWSRDAR